MKNQLALWSGISAFFATLLAIGTIDIFNPNDQVRLLSAIAVGLITAGAMYSKQRLDDEKLGRTQKGVIKVSDQEDKRVFSLELEGDPNDLKDKQEVIFKVDRSDG